jgi:peroxiredoxin
MQSNLTNDLPVPEDDGACNHLTGKNLPDLELDTTDGRPINFSTVSGYVVIYIYPMTGRPDVELPDGWAQIPGAMGCTPQTCSFRDHYEEIKRLNSVVYGLSTQTTEYQKEAADRLHLSFPLVSDADLKFISSLSIPTMKAAGMILGKRVTLIANNGVIEKVFYPVFPPGENAEQVIAYLGRRDQGKKISA